MFSIVSRFQALLFAVILSACGSGSSDNSFRATADGAEQSFEIDGTQVSVSIPAGALSAPVDIELDVLTENELASQFPDIDTPVLALDLQPTGTQFDQPVEFEVTLADSLQEGVLFASLESDGTIQAIEELEIIANADGTTTARFSIDHFSTASFHEANYRFTSELVQTQVPVGQNISLVHRLERDAAELGADINSDSLFLSRNGLTSNISVVGLGEESFSIERISAGNSLTITDSNIYRCDSEGAFLIAVTPRLELIAGTFFGIAEFEDAALTNVSGECVAVTDDGTDDGSGGGTDDGSDDGADGGTDGGADGGTDGGADGSDNSGGVSVSFDVPDIAFVGETFDVEAVAGSIQNEFLTITSSSISSNLNAGLLTTSFNLSASSTGFSIQEITCNDSFDGLSAPFEISYNIQEAVPDGENPPENPTSEQFTFQGTCFKQPAANDDSAQTSIATLVDINVVANDVNALVSNADSSFSIRQPVSVTSQPSNGTATVVEDEGASEFLELIRYQPNNFFSGEDSFIYRLGPNDDDPTATVTITVGDASVNPYDECNLSADFGTCADFGGGTAVCGDFPPQASVSCSSLVSEFRSCVQPLDIDGNTAGTSGLGVFEFMCPEGADLRPPSEPGEVTVSSSAGTLNIIINEDGTISFGDMDMLDDPGFEPSGDNLLFTTDIDSAQVPVLLENSAGTAALDFPEIDGLNTRIELLADLEFVVVFIFTHDESTQLDGSPAISGLIERREVSDGTATENGFLLPLVSPELLEWISENDIEITEDVVISGRNEEPIEGIFDAGEGGAASGATPAGGGIVVRVPAGGSGGGGTPGIPSAGLVCPDRPTNVRCTAGPEEALLVVNNSDDIARYNIIDGTFEGFFFGGTTPNFSIGTGYEALQGPDNCVLYSDLQGDLHLYDVSGSRIDGDGDGNTVADGGPLLVGDQNSVFEYSGFDFHSPDGINWDLYVAQRTSSNVAQLVRYDYATTGDAVLTNPSVIFETEDGEFNDVMVLGDQIFLTDETPDSSETPQDLVRVFDADGNELASIVTDSVTPTQISPTFDGGVVLADFARETVRVLTADGETRRDYLVGDGDGSGEDRIRGVYPLRNGDYLVTGRSDFNRQVLDRQEGTLREEPDGRSSSGYLIGTACLNL